jgi:hypothetical protein
MVVGVWRRRLLTRWVQKVERGRDQLQPSKVCLQSGDKFPLLITLCLE